MPCFKGLAVSIHTPDGPLPEHSIQKQSRFSRISCYIPVPPAKVPPHSTTNEAEQSTFAISITLLTPGLVVPYSLPKPTPENPHPRPRIVGDIPSHGSEHGGIDSVIAPYMSISASVNETVAAYIYFDGRVKEEVATLLRKGEETWVNSRWVSVEGGGLAEREFLFREVGLENWLNGLDLEGDDTAAKIERRRQKMERKRQAKRQREADVRVIFDKDGNIGVSIRPPRADEQSPQESMSDNDDMISSGSESDDDDPIPEAAGQIKVALYRVLASGEVKKGEYSPQFGAHDDDDESMKDADKGMKPNRSMAGQAEVDHTTSFAEPKSLDPTCISTQTVTSIDPPEKPYAVFTFLYRGERQLQKMGILRSPKSQDKLETSVTKPISRQVDFAKLKPLKAGGMKRFTGFRDPRHEFTFSGNANDKKMKDDSDTDSEEDEDGLSHGVKLDQMDVLNTMLSSEDAKTQGELAEGVQKIKLKRQHSAEHVTTASPSVRKSPVPNTPTAGSTPTPAPDAATSPPSFPPSDVAGSSNRGENVIGSPLKKQRASLSAQDHETMGERLGLGLSGAIGDLMAQIERGPEIKMEDEAKPETGVKTEDELQTEVKTEDGVQADDGVQTEDGIQMEDGIKVGEEVKTEAEVKTESEVKMEEDDHDEI